MRSDAGVGQDGRAAGLGDQRQALLRGQAAVRHGGRAAVGQVAVEGVLAVARVPGGDDGVGQVGAADGAGRPGGDVAERRRARLGEEADDLAGAGLRAARTRRAAGGLEGRRLAPK